MLKPYSIGYTAAMHSEIAELFLDHSIGKLDQAARELSVCLAKLDDGQVWHRNAPHENTIGNLILHLCGNMRQWVVHGVGGALDIRVRDAEFAANDSHSVAQLKHLFESTVAESKEVIARLGPERLTQRIKPQNRDVSVLEAIYQVVGHVQQHAGQIILLTKQISRQDLDLTIPRPR